MSGINIFVNILIVLSIFYVLFHIDDFINFYQSGDGNYNDTENISNYFFQNGRSLYKGGKTIFIHVPIDKKNRDVFDREIRSLDYDMNSDLAIPLLCIKSVIKTCSGKHDIILLDNQDILDILKSHNLLDECTKNVELSNIMNTTTLKNLQDYCKAKILYTFGGIMMEPVFYFCKCFPQSILDRNEFQITKYVNEGMKQTNVPLVPSTEHLMVSNKENKKLEAYMNYLKIKCLNPELFENEYFEKMYLHLSNLITIDPKTLCIVNKFNEPIFTSDWISSNKELYLSDKYFCIFFNVPFIKKSRHHRWFINLPEKALLDSGTILARYMKHFQYKKT